MIAAALALVALGVAALPAEGATVRSRSGATAQVAPGARSAFQCLVDKYDAAGVRIVFMGGYGKRPFNYSLHPKGLALDINQYSRNVTRPATPAAATAWARSCGLIHGANWGHADTGHFQLGGWAGRRSVTRVARARPAKGRQMRYAAAERPRAVTSSQAP